MQGVECPDYRLLTVVPRIPHGRLAEAGGRVSRFKIATRECFRLTTIRPERLRVFPRFAGEAFYENRKLVVEVERIAKEKGVTVAQVALSWVVTMSGKNGLPVIIPIPGATTIPRVEENMTKIDLTEADVTSINNLLKGFKASGTRYPAALSHFVNG